MITEDARLAVKKGSYWLDLAYPEWLGAIELASLDLARGNTCILGQLATPDEYYLRGEGENGYGATIDFLESAMPYGEALEWATEHGFVASGDGTTWGELTRLWIDHINERTSHGTSA